MRTIDYIDLAKIEMRGKYPFDERVLHYANLMKQGEVFPPIKVKNIGKGKFRIKDGRHRYLANKLVGNKKIKCMFFKEIR